MRETQEKKLFLNLYSSNEDPQLSGIFCTTSINTLSVGSREEGQEESQGAFGAVYKELQLRTHMVRDYVSVF